MDTFTHDFTIATLGECGTSSPFNEPYPFVPDERRVLFKHYLHDYDQLVTHDGTPLSVEAAGPRKMIYFTPPEVHAAIVTCGGLCPGINDVIRSVVMELYYRYGVRKITGIRYGFQGLIPEYGHVPFELNPEIVKDIHSLGGSILSSSRGNQPIAGMVDTIEREKINLFFCIGGDGTMKAADLIADEISTRNLAAGVIGIPKTIDNDLNLIDKTFGFDTAISEVVKVIKCAHVEAKGAPYGIGLVKVMGRESGFIAAWATLSHNDVNVALVPEVPFDMQGEKGFLHHLEQRLRHRHHAVILVAEGAGQDMEGTRDVSETDASGNIKLFDIGQYLKEEITRYFTSTDMDINLKYIDPSYTIRSVPANAGDSGYCHLLGQYAVHAGMAGKTGMLIGLFNNEFVHFPLKAVTSRRKMDPGGSLWLRVLEATGQPASMKN